MRLSTILAKVELSFLFSVANAKKYTNVNGLITIINDHDTTKAKNLKENNPPFFFKQFKFHFDRYLLTENL